MEPLLNINKKILFFFIIISPMFCSCLTIKNYDYIECEDIPREAIDIAIKSHNKRLQVHKNSDVIAVVLDAYYISERKLNLFMRESVKGDIVDKFPVETLYEYVGQIPSSSIPTDYIEINNVLYVWHNPHIVLGEEIINRLIKYDMVWYPGEEMIYTIGGTSIDYIFSTSNYKIYIRKVVESY